MAKFFKSAFWKKFLRYTPVGWALNLFDSENSTAVGNLLKGVTGSGLTTAQIEQNEWNSKEANVQRDWTEQMDNTKYQRQVNDMQMAGLNPAMMYGQGVSATTPSGSAASGTGGAAPSAGALDSIMNIIFATQRLRNLKAEQKEIESQADKNTAEASAVTRNATSNERQASVAEVRAGIERDLADSNISLNEGTLDQLAASAAYMRELKEYISKNYEVAVKNADSLHKQAYAAIRQADAAVQNAATASFKADYETDLMFSNTLLNDILKGEHQVILENLPERTRNEIDNLKKQGVLMDKQGNLVDKYGKKVSAETVKTYINCATDVLNSVANIAGSGLSLGSPAKIGF